MTRLILAFLVLFAVASAANAQTATPTATATATATATPTNTPTPGVSGTPIAANGSAFKSLDLDNNDTLLEEPDPALKPGKCRLYVAREALYLVCANGVQHRMTMN